MITLSARDFERLRGFIRDAAGVTLGPAKQALVSGRLERRLRHHRVTSYADYMRLLDDETERELAVDLLTTHETRFWREPLHFESLQGHALTAEQAARPLRVWSAACSSGEETYSIAMVLSDVQRELPWELLGTDISAPALQLARRGHYPCSRAEELPDELRRRHCLKGIDRQAGTLLVNRSLRERVQFAQVNLDRTLPPWLQSRCFDVIFLRNVMIYFDPGTKAGVLARVLARLAPGGLLFIGRAETLGHVEHGLQMLRPSVFRKPGGAP